MYDLMCPCSGGGLNEWIDMEATSLPTVNPLGIEVYAPDPDNNYYYFSIKQPNGIRQISFYSNQGYSSSNVFGIFNFDSGSFEVPNSLLNYMGKDNLNFVFRIAWSTNYKKLYYRFENFPIE